MNKLGMGYWALGIEKILLSFFLLLSSFFFLLIAKRGVSHTPELLVF
jgi:hypothetical protein